MSAAATAQRAHQSQALALLARDFEWSDWQQRFLRSIARQRWGLTEKQADMLVGLAEWPDMVEQAREVRDISAIVGRHTYLKARGARGEMVGLCPFHQERTAS